MYSERFDTDWQQLSIEEAIQRMYALGVSAELGASMPDERDRILGAATRSYTQKVLQLAYQEGTQAAKERAGDDAAAFEALLTRTPSVLEPDDETEDDSSAADGPPDVVQPPSMLTFDETDDPDRFDVPGMLKRGDDG